MVIADDRKSDRAKRVLPPVSTARGGLLPGVVLANLRPLQEADDIEADLLSMIPAWARG
jgi:hypothetical protein